MTGHAFARPGQVAADRPAPDACMACGKPEAEHDTGQGWIHPDAPSHIISTAWEALALYDRWKAGSQSDQALGRAITDQLARALSTLLGEFEPEPEWDSQDSNAHQDRVEAGLEPEWPDN